MKRIVFLITLTASLIFTGQALAATETPADPAPTTAASGSSDIKQKQIDDLKERLATKVAQLQQSQRRAIAGSIKSTSVSTAIVETKTKDVKIELLDEIKIFQLIKGKRTQLTTDDLAKGDTVVVFGDYDTTLDLLKAKVVFIQNLPPARVSGSVTDINKELFTLTLTTPEGHTETVDFEKTTKTIIWDKENGLVKAGFSKITIGDTVHITGTPVPKKENRISALRILDIGNVSGVIPTPTATSPTNEATTGAVSPTKKPTSKPTPTPTPTQ